MANRYNRSIEQKKSPNIMEGYIDKLPQSPRQIKQSWWDLILDGRLWRLDCNGLGAGMDSELMRIFVYRRARTAGRPVSVYRSQEQEDVLYVQASAFKPVVMWDRSKALPAPELPLVQERAEVVAKQAVEQRFANTYMLILAPPESLVEYCRREGLLFSFAKLPAGAMMMAARVDQLPLVMHSPQPSTTVSNPDLEGCTCGSDGPRHEPSCRVWGQPVPEDFTPPQRPDTPASAPPAELMDSADLQQEPPVPPVSGSSVSYDPNPYVHEAIKDLVDDSVEPIEPPKVLAVVPGLADASAGWIPTEEDLLLAGGDVEMAHQYVWVRRNCSCGNERELESFMHHPDCTASL